MPSIPIYSGINNYTKVWTIFMKLQCRFAEKQVSSHQTPNYFDQCLSLEVSGRERCLSFTMSTLFGACLERPGPVATPIGVGAVRCAGGS